MKMLFIRCQKITQCSVHKGKFLSEQTSYNRLKNENSAYLKQHENNPVHWWAWGPEAPDLKMKINRSF